MTHRGFTLIETLVAVTFLTLAVVAPMTLATQSLSSAYYARDQVTAFHLAQEALESVRSARDANILYNALTPGGANDILDGIPTDAPFVVDTRDNTMVSCTSDCPPLKTDGTFYAYGPVGTTDIYSGVSGWTATRFTRSVFATYVSAPDEINISATVSWQSGPFRERSFTISENLYRWVPDGTVGFYSEASYYSEGAYYSEGSYGAGQACTVDWDCPNGMTCNNPGNIPNGGTCQ